MTGDRSAVTATPDEPARTLFHINGTSAWEEAHKHGFEFYPVPQHFLVVTIPRDGVDTRLQDDMPAGATVFARVTMGELFAYGGTLGGTYTYRLFAGRDLASGSRPSARSGAWGGRGVDGRSIAGRRGRSGRTRAHREVHLNGNMTGRAEATRAWSPALSNRNPPRAPAPRLLAVHP